MEEIIKVSLYGSRIFMVKANFDQMQWLPQNTGPMHFWAAELQDGSKVIINVNHITCIEPL